MDKESKFCAVCDHQIVPGVACDGPTRARPHQHLSRSFTGRLRLTRYAAVLDSFSGCREYDVVRGEA